MAMNQQIQSVSVILLLAALCGALLGGVVGAFLVGVYMAAFAICGAMTTCAIAVAWMLMRDG